MTSYTPMHPDLDSNVSSQHFLFNLGNVLVIDYDLVMQGSGEEVSEC